MSIAFRDGDVAFLFKDTGVPITLNGVAGLGLVTENDQVVVTDGGRAEVVGGVTTVVVQSSKFNFKIRSGLTIVVDGNNYTVRQLVPTDDAALVKFVLGSV